MEPEPATFAPIDLESEAALSFSESAEETFDAFDPAPTDDEYAQSRPRRPSSPSILRRPMMNSLRSG